MENLQDINEKMSTLLTGALILVAAFMVTGFIGNLHVIVIYAFRMKSTNHRIFILFLSTLDLTACTIGMPLTIDTLRRPLLYATKTTCKLYAFSNYFICIASAFTLLVIVFERYRKICKPFGWQMLRRHANYSCTLVLCIALLCSLPVLFFADSNRQQSTKYPWISASVCVSVHKKANNYYHIFLSIVFLFSGVALIVLYTLIWKVTKKCSMHIKPLARGSNEKSGFVFKSSVDDLSHSPACAVVGLSENVQRQSELKNALPPWKMSSKGSHFTKPKKTTIAFSLITVIFFITYIPYLALKITFGVTDFIYFTNTEFVILNMAYTIVYINNMANCFIYGCVDARFRHEIKAMYMRLLRFKQVSTD